jgi:hypothetical protein
MPIVSSPPFDAERAIAAPRPPIHLRLGDVAAEHDDANAPNAEFVNPRAMA